MNLLSAINKVYAVSEGASEEEVMFFLITRWKKKPTCVRCSLVWQVSKAACILTTQPLMRILRSREAAASVNVKTWPTIIDTGRWRRRHGFRTRGGPRQSGDSCFTDIISLPHSSVRPQGVALELCRTEETYPRPKDANVAKLFLKRLSV